MCNLLSDCGCWHKGSARYRQPARLALVYEVDVHSRLTMVVRRSGAAIYYARAAGPEVVAQSPRPRPRRTSSRLFGGSAELLIDHAVASSRVHRNSLPSAQIRCITIANFRAAATTARRRPRRLATLTPQAFNADQRLVRVRSASAA